VREANAHIWHQKTIGLPNKCMAGNPE